MSEYERELENRINEFDGSGEDSSRLRDELRGEEERQRHARNR